MDREEDERRERVERREREGGERERVERGRGYFSMTSPSSRGRTELELEVNNRTWMIRRGQ